jgi:hypothetical protein
MSYATHAAIAGNYAILQRCTAAAAQEGVTEPDRWINGKRWHLPTSEWVAAWESAEAANPGDDHGADPAVVPDPMILSRVQFLKG